MDEFVPGEYISLVENTCNICKCKWWEFECDEGYFEAEGICQQCVDDLPE